MKYFRIIIFTFAGLTLLLSSCDGDKKSKNHLSTTKKDVKKKSLKIPAFNGDSAFAHVKKQVDFGPRVTGREAHSQAKKWFVEKFKSYGAEVKLQDFKASFGNKTNVKATNIIASFNPGKSKKVIIASHYDSRYRAEKDKDPNKQEKAIDGADDGASGVGVIFELARLLKDNPIDLSVDFILFDAEDNGDSDKGDESWCLGSQYWSKNASTNNYKADFGILLDLVGAKGAVYPKEAISQRFAGPVQTVIWDLAAKMGYGDLFINVQRGSINDDHLYVNKDAKIPMVDIINIQSDGFGAYHHTHDDNIDLIDKDVLRRTGQVVITLLFKYSDDSL